MTHSEYISRLAESGQYTEQEITEAMNLATKYDAQIARAAKAAKH